jgi:hypothetical protein
LQALQGIFSQYIAYFKVNLPKERRVTLRIGILLLCVLVLIGSCGCAPTQADFFAPFRGAFVARIAGEWHAVAFEGELSASAPAEDGTREMTLTFYAPSLLCGTVLTKDTQGVLTLTVDDVSLPLSPTAAEGYGALFALFPTTGEIHTITRENGNTRLVGVGFSLLFAADGTPLAAENAAARVEITAWE